MVTLTLSYHGETMDITGRGNGRLDAVANAIRKNLHLTFDILDYNEHSLTSGSTSQACAYVQIFDCMNENRFGVGIHDDIIAASIYALTSAINRAILGKDDVKEGH